MGCCSSLTAAEKEAIQISLALEKDNFAHFNTQQAKIRLLLLGTGDSGKSTILKQFRILYGEGFTPSDRLWYITSIHQNIIACIKEICLQIKKFGYTQHLAESSHLLIKKIQGISEYDPMTAEIGGVIKEIWNDKAAQMTWKRKAEFQVTDSEVFFGRIDDVAAYDYSPTDADILLTRIRTTGIVEEKYLIGETQFIILDVGGQRNERKKWIHCFEDVGAIIYITALSEYDQFLFEDETVNRMVESLTLFGEICNSRWFVQTDMILFLNKSDLFATKIAKVSIQSIPSFASYSGEDNDYDAGIKYFVDEFMMRNKCDKDIFFHVTCATDSFNVRVVFDACREMILKNNLEESGLWHS